MRYKFCKFLENRARDTPLRGVYIPHFGQIWVKISILGVLHPCRWIDGGEIWHGGGDLPFGPLLHAKFHPHRCNVSPLRGEKPQNRPLSKLNTGRFALRAMLPVITMCACVHTNVCYSQLAKVTVLVMRHCSRCSTTLPGNEVTLVLPRCGCSTSHSWQLSLKRLLNIHVSLTETNDNQQATSVSILKTKLEQPGHNHKQSDKTAGHGCTTTALPFYSGIKNVLITQFHSVTIST